MNRKVLAAVLAVLGLAAISYVGAHEVAATVKDLALSRARDQAVSTVGQAAMRPGADQYVAYLNKLVAKADCYLNGPQATCDYNETEVRELTAALDEGARATQYLTADYGPSKNNSTGATAPASNAKNQNTTTKTNQASQNPTTTVNSPAINRAATSSVARTDDEEEIESSDEGGAAVATNVEVPKASEEATSSRNDAVKDNAPLRVGLAVLAGVVILTAGVTIIWKWSKGNV